MNRRLRFFVLAGFLTVAFVGTLWAADIDEPASGEELAARLRSLAPAKMSEITGTLKIRAGSVRKEVPFLLRDRKSVV